MRFHETLQKGQINEWKGYYIPYDDLKSLIKQDSVLFVTKIHESLKLVNDFYLRLERSVIDDKNIIKRRYANLDNNTNLNSDTKLTPILKQSKKIRSVDDCGSVHKSRFDILNLFKWKDRYLENKNEKNLKKKIRACEFVKKYAKLNFQGFRKILKKHDKLHRGNLSETLFPTISNSYVFKSTRIDSTLIELKELYRVRYAKNDKRKAKHVFHNIMRRGDPMDQVYSFVAGLLLAFSLFSIHIMDLSKEDDATFIFYTNLIYYGLLLFGFCMIIFRKYYINYKFIFELEVSTCGTIASYFMLISIFAFITNVGFYLAQKFFKIQNGFFLFANVAILFWPFNILSRQSRFFFIKTFFKVLTTPLFQVRFPHFVTADCLISFMPCIIRIIKPRSYGVLFLQLLPLIIRILQCIRRIHEDKILRTQLYNILKLFLSIVAILTAFIYALKSTNNMLVILIAVNLVSSAYSLVWDVFVDWEMQLSLNLDLKPSLRSNINLDLNCNSMKSKRMFPRFFLFFIVGFNICARFVWVFLMKYDKRIAVAIEITRRFMWLLVRTECEHLNNSDALRAISGIDLKISDMFYKNSEEIESVISEDEANLSMEAWNKSDIEEV